MQRAYDTANVPTLSVITVVFNGYNEIAKTINSVLAQDYPCIEYIIVDGNSHDGTNEIIRKYAEALDVYISECDEGVYDAMNKGVRLARGDFLLFMNCGDVFASSDAASSAMKFIEPVHDQIIFGCWLRQTSDHFMQHQAPILMKGLFNHQAVIYSRNIHQWHGLYVNLKGLTTADYLFFATLFTSPHVKCKVINTTIAIIDVNGVSAGLQTLSQKYVIDFLCGRVDRVKLLIVLLMHPIYRGIKNIFKRLQ